MIMEKFINGECGEQLQASTARIKTDNGREHESVIIELDGVTKDNNDELSVVLSPFMAKVLAEAIKNAADEAYEVNYHLLVGKTPF